MKRKWIIILAVPMLALVALFVYPTPGTNKAPFTIRLLRITNDAAGAKVALFGASNGTDRLFVRGRSEIEIHDTSSNQVMVTQITNVDYLKSGQSISFAVPCATNGAPWRLKFYYVGQFSRLESLKYELGWFLYRHGFKVPVNRLPQHDVRQIITDWIEGKR